MAPPHHEAWGGACVSWANALEDDAYQVYAVNVHVYHSYTYRTYSHNKRQRSVIPLSSPLFHDTRVAVLGGVVVVGQKHTWSESCCRQMVPNYTWWHSRCNMCPDFIPGCCLGGHAAETMRPSRRESVLCGYAESGKWVWECSTDNCWKQRYTTDTLCPKCATIRRYTHPASRRHNSTPFKWLKLFNRNAYSSAGHGCTIEWMLQTLFISQSTTVRPVESKQRPPVRHLIADDRDKWITNTYNPQYAHTILWCQWT